MSDEKKCTAGCGIDDGYGMHFHHCDLPAGHGGHHSENGISWPDLHVTVSEPWENSDPTDESNPLWNDNGWAH